MDDLVKLRKETDVAQMHLHNLAMQNVSMDPDINAKRSVEFDRANKRWLDAERKYRAALDVEAKQ